MSKIIMIFKRFERFWHWAQALLILLLTISGLEIHGVFVLFGFETAVFLHNFAGFSWAVLIVLIFTWILTTGEWQHYLPSLKGIDKTLRFYLHGVFKGHKHPHHLSATNKFNPLQRIAYIGIVFVMLPVQLITGLLFYFYPELREMGLLARIDFTAIVHTFIAFSLLAFFVIHLYLITFGKQLHSHLKAMISGKEEVDD